MTQRSSRLSAAVHSLTGADLSSVRTWWDGSERRGSDDAGPGANQRLTALTGAIVLALAALALLTGLFFGNVWRVHYFAGYLLLPVALLKIASTSYRALRYYLRSGPYRLVRPPYPLARLSSPALVVSVAVLFVSGVAMWLTHSQADPWGWLHTDAAIAFSAIVLLHLGMYLPEALRAAQGDIRPARLATLPRRSRRLAVIGAAVLAGLLLALATIGFSQLPARSHRERRLRPGTSAGSATPGFRVGLNR